MNFPRDPEGLRRAWEVETARAWRRSGLLDEAQLRAVAEAGPPPPASAGWAVRVLLFGLTAVAVLAVTYFATGRFRSQAIGAPLVVEGLLLIVAGELLASRLRLRRFGAEECLLLAGPAALAFGAGGLLEPHRFSGSVEARAAAAAAGALGFAYVYARERRLAAAIGGALCLGFLVVAGEPRSPRLWLAGCWAALLLAAVLRPCVPEHEAPTWDVVIGALALLVPIAVNQRLEGLMSWRTHAAGAGSGLLYWGCYAAGWLWPAAVLAAGLRRRARPSIAAGILGLLLAIATNKPYLGLERRSWDPALLGAALLAAAYLLDRWLRAGPGEARGGFTARALVVGREDGFGAVELLAAAAPGLPERPSTDRFDGGGGKSGGAGASGGF